MTHVVAYFGAYASPAWRNGRPGRDSAEVSVKLSNNSWRRLFRVFDDHPGADQVFLKRDAELLTVILRHHTGQEPARGTVERILGTPAVSICRLEPVELDRLLGRSYQLELSFDEKPKKKRKREKIGAGQ